MALKHVVVGGGTGFIGSRLVDCLRREGNACTIISRMPGPNRMSWHDVEQKGLPEDTTAVINVAGQNILDYTHRWTAGFRQNVQNSRIRTTKVLADAVVKTQAQVLVTISGVSCYKPDQAVTYTEDDPCMSYDFLSELCRDWEEAAQLPKDCKIRQVIIRSGVVLGKQGGMIQQIYLPFKLGLGGPLGDGRQYMPWIHITDLVNLFLFALKNDQVSGVLNGVAPEPATNAEFTKAFSRALWRPAIFPVPKQVLNLVFNEERAKIMLEGQKIKPKRVQELGFQYTYPDIESACKELVS